MADESKLIKLRYIFETGASSTPGAAHYTIGWDWRTFLETLNTNTLTPRMLRDMTSQPHVAAASLNLVVLEDPVQCTNTGGELLGELDTNQRRRLLNAPRKVIQDVSSRSNLDEIIVEDLDYYEDPPHTTTYIISKQILNLPVDELKPLLTLSIGKRIPPVWNLEIIQSNCTFLDTRIEGHQMAIDTIKSYKKRLSEKRVIPRSIYKSDSESLNLYREVRRLVPEDTYKKYFEEEKDPDEEMDDGHRSDAGSALPPNSSSDLGSVSHEELVGIICTISLMKRIAGFHRRSYSQSSSIRTTNFCQLFPSVPLTIDWVAKDADRRYTYTEGQYSGLSALLTTTRLGSIAFHPKPDFHLQNGYLLPLIGEVDSNIEEQDKYRMLANAIILSRVGTWAFPEGVSEDPNDSSKREPFIVLAMFVSKKMTVDLYWTHTVYGVHTVILKEELDPSEIGLALLLHVTFYNLRQQWSKVPDMDPERQRKLEAFKRDLKDTFSKSSSSDSSKKRKGPDSRPNEEGSSSDSSKKKRAPNSQSNDKGSSSGQSRGLGSGQRYNSRAEGSQTPTLDDYFTPENRLMLYGFPSPKPTTPKPIPIHLETPNTEQPTHIRVLLEPEATLVKDFSELVSVCLNNTKFLIRDFLHVPIHPPQLVGNDAYQGIYSNAVVPVEMDDFLGKELEIAIQVLDCVCVLHTLKVVHLDINVLNFVWDKNTSSVKLSKFALARKCPDTEAKISGPVGILVPPIDLREYNPYHVDNYATGLVVAYLLEDANPDPEDLDPLQFLAKKANCMIRDRQPGPEQVLQEFREQYDRFGIKPSPIHLASASSLHPSIIPSSKMSDFVLFVLAVVGAVALLRALTFPHEYHFLPEADGFLESTTALASWMTLFYFAVRFMSGRFVLMLVFKSDQSPEDATVDPNAMDVDEEEYFNVF
ncbi:hypothetical protein K435DRAFT_856020 [Dendrothele bispora CBS 962.96]|uniref:Protein kinase domain-containing protein n=1 Tax=Dendrothele bispora (strain CBS 962.96) TaxID=1314807 RepID=A0A4S8M9H5_DENBC|nr:hypothetical protein K435DRAFT_856020 [Dendrothele bispora CBS 962.96]